MSILDREARIKQHDLVAIQQILFDGIAAANDAETHRFWDGYAMCLHNLEKALVTNIQVSDATDGKSDG